MKHVFICTPAKDEKYNGFRMETATLEFVEQGGSGDKQVLITNRSGQTLRLDMDAIRALGCMLADMEKQGLLK